jgi:hypothetical protein
VVNVLRKYLNLLVTLVAMKGGGQLHLVLFEQVRPGWATT